jgi:TolB-like protein
MIRILLLGGLLLAAGCASVITTGNPAGETLVITRLLLPPFVNATDDEHAPRALTEMTGSALVQAGIPLYQTEELVIRTAADQAQGPDGRYAEIARSVGASHLLIGTVHEYRYKTDLDGDPAVGVTMRLVEAATGRTVWQGTSGNVGYAFASVTSASQKAVNRLVGEMPVAGNRLNKFFRVK